MSSSPLKPSEQPSYEQSTARLDDLIERGFSMSGHERNCVFLNTGGGRFATASAITGMDFADDARALVTSDWDGDGDLDVWTSNRTAPMLRFLKNNSERNSQWLAVRLMGTTSNRDAIGATATLHEDDGPIARSVKAGDGFLSQSSKWLHFGFGTPGTRSMMVRWPGGAQEVFDGLEPGARWRLKQGSGRPERLPTRAVPDIENGPLPSPSPRAAVRALVGSRMLIPQLPYLSADGTAKIVGGRSDSFQLINLWATWCAPCRAELKAFGENETALRAAGVKVWALSVDSLAEGGAAADPAAVLAKLDFPFDSGKATPVLLKRVNAARSRAWGVQWDLPVPTSILLDRYGRLVAFYSGPVEVAQILNDVKLAEQTGDDFHDQSLPFDGKWIERPETRNNIAPALDLMKAGALGDARDFVERAEVALAKHPEFGTLSTWIGDELMKRGQPADALTAYEKAVTADPSNVLVLNNLAWQLAAHADQKIRDGKRAVHWAEKAAEITERKDPAILDTLAAAYAENGQFEEAVATGERALALAEKADQAELAAGIRNGLQFYQRSRPYGR